MLNIASEILVPLCKEVLLEKRARAALSSHLSRRQSLALNLRCADLGLGTVNTWHGTPDLRVRGGEFVCWNVEEGEDKRAALVSSVDSGDEAASISSEGRTTTCEGKFIFNEASLQQAIATCVTSSFTEKTCHPKKPPIVPTILIDQNAFRVCFYDCEKDILLLSPLKNLSTKGSLSQSAMALLWVVLNHR